MMWNPSVNAIWLRAGASCEEVARRSGRWAPREMLDPASHRSPAHRNDAPLSPTTTGTEGGPDGIEWMIHRIYAGQSFTRSHSTVIDALFPHTGNKASITVGSKPTPPLPQPRPGWRRTRVRAMAGPSEATGAEAGATAAGRHRVVIVGG